MSENEGCVCSIITAIIMVVFGYVVAGVSEELGASRRQSDWLEYTVTEGKAEFFLDAKNERQWRWKEKE